MSGPSVDLEKPNVIGGLDKLVTNFAISALAVFPTFLTCVGKPWRLRALLDLDDPDGRVGMLLAPGAFFPLSLLVSFLIAALLATPETLNSNGSFIGPGLAIAVKAAASEGDIWKLIATIMPIYGIAVLLGLLGTLLKPVAHQDWTLRVSLRAAFYVVGVLTSWMILTTAIIDLIRVSTGNNDVFHLYMLVFVPTVLSIIWMYFGFFWNGGTVSKVRSGALSVAMFGLMIGVFILADFLVRL